MNRYFEIVGKKQTLKIDVEKNSSAEKATSEEISNHFNKELRELDASEYRRLTIQFNA